MKTRMNQKGYALLIVLFLIVFIMTVMAIFMRGSIGTAKQEQLVDNNNIAVVTAEMGVEYYTTKFSNKFNGNSKGIWEKHKQIFLDKIKSNPKMNTSDEIYNTEINIQNEIIEVLKSVSLEPPGFANSLETNKQFSFSMKPEQLIICGVGKCNQFGVIVIEGEVTGVYDDSSRAMDFTLTFQIPNLFKSGPEGEDSPGGKEPVPPEGSNIVTDWPCKDNDCYKTVNNYMKVGDVSMKKGALIVNDSVVANSLRIEGGNGADITVARDLYIADKLDVQNHACIAVQGSLTVGNKIESKNKMYIYVYGDAYFPSNIDLTSANNAIYVSGDVYIDGKKQIPKSFGKVPDGGKHGNCNLPGKGSNNNNPPIQNSWEWKEPDINVYYK